MTLVWFAKDKDKSNGALLLLRSYSARTELIYFSQTYNPLFFILCVTLKC